MPIAIINEPEKFSVDPLHEAAKNAERPEEKKIKIKVRYAGTDTQLKEFSNVSTIAELKSAYVKAFNKEEVTYDRLRLLFMGRELKDEYELHHYKIVEDMTVQAMLRPKEDKEPV